MGLITKTVFVELRTNVKYYEELGYEIPYVKNKKGKLFVPRGTKLEVKVEDLPKESHIIVERECDGCGKKKFIEYRAYLKQVREDGKIYCSKCAMNEYGVENIGTAKLRNGKSFYVWCVENERQDVIDRWDYELNNCSPKDITYSTNKKYYFKCNVHPEHLSELKSINAFTRG